MNRFLTIGLLLLTSFNLQAQGLSAGLRANAGYRWPVGDQRATVYEGDNYEHTFVMPEVFVRFETQNGWAYEAAYSHTRYHRPDVYADVYDAPYDTVIVGSKGFCHDLMVSVQYELGRLYCEKPTTPRKLHHYAGLSIGLFLLRGETVFYPDYAPNTPEMIFEDLENGLWLGGNYMLVYNLGKRLNLTGSAYFKVRSHALNFSSIVYGYHQPAAQVGLQIGASYRIF